MKLIQLGRAEDGVNSFLVGLSGRQILLDCGLNLKAMAHLAVDGQCRYYAPNLHVIDPEAVDCVVISNHWSFLGLPLLTERTAFRGAVYTTEPCVRFGRLLLLEMLELLERKRKYASHIQPSKKWMSRTDIKELPPAEQSRLLDLEFDKWVEPYTRHEIESCLNRITYVMFRETISFAYELQITAVSSGFALGSCAWILESAMEKLVYIPAASSETNRHPAALDVESFRDCDVILLTDLKVERNPLVDTTVQIETFLSHAMRVYARGGTSLVPCTIDGVFFDLMENWEGLLKARQHPPIPIYVVSPVASEVCNAVFGPQWLCESKIAKICAGEPSFLHTKMLEEGQLKILPHVSPALMKALEEPCIIFMSDPSFRLGEAAGVLAQLEAKNSGNAVIGIDPQISLAHALAPYQPLPSIEVIHAPIDMRLSCNEANTLLVECLPQHLIVPACFTLKQLKEDQSVRYLHELIASRPVTSTNILHTLEPILVVKQHKKNVDAVMDPELAAQTTLTLIDKSAAALLQTQIELSQDQCILRPVNTSDVGRANKRLCIREVSNVLLGELNQNQLIQILENEYGAVHTQYQDDTLVLSFRDSIVTYSVHENKTSISSSDEGVRQRICQLIVAQLCVLPY